MAPDPPGWEGGAGQPSEIPEGTRAAVWRPIVVGVLLVLVVGFLGGIDWLIVVAGFVAMIMLHELGHFATAKWTGMKVSEYFLGFGPKLWSFKRGETEYGIKAIPAGGYVKIVGMSSSEEVEAEEETRTYRQQVFWRKLLVIAAGPGVNLVLAFLLAWASFGFFGRVQPNTVAVVGFTELVNHQDPAKAAGLAVGDVIVSADGKTIQTESDLMSVLGSHAGKPVDFVVLRDGQHLNLTVVPENSPIPGAAGNPSTSPNATPATSAHIGVELNGKIQYPGFLASAGAAGIYLGQDTSGTVAALGHRFSPTGLHQFWDDLTNSKDAQKAASTGDRPISIVGAADLAHQAAEVGWGPLLGILASVNLALGLLNLLPMLPLDGGHIAVATYERLRSRRQVPYHADVNKLAPVAALFLGALMVLFLSALFLDITHPFHLGGH